jgi:hypothetical protein
MRALTAIDPVALATDEGRVNVHRSILAFAMMLVWTSGAAAAPAEVSSLAPVHGEAQAVAALAGSEPAGSVRPTRTTTCDLIESAAAVNGLPVEYFTRLIWKESSFRAEAVSPKGAQGIAQFMPATAAERGLVDPFDPRQAIPASAQLLKHLAERFGNLGLAAAAYNSGATRVENWLAGAGGLPQETRDYVAAITGRPVDDWRALRTSDEPVGTDRQVEPAACLDVLARLAAPARMQLQALQTQSAEGEWQPWGVQVAGNFSQAKALATYRDLQQRYPSVLGDRAPLIVRKRNLSLGTRPMVNVRLAAPTRQAADDLCSQLRAKGAPCIVLKN